MSAEGKVFYINHTNKSTQWTRPEAPPDEMAETPILSSIPTVEEESDGAPSEDEESGHGASTTARATTKEEPTELGGSAEETPFVPKAAGERLDSSAVAHDATHVESNSAGAGTTSPLSAVKNSRAEEAGSRSAAADAPARESTSVTERAMEPSSAPSEPGAVSSIVKSGLFGETVSKTGGSSGSVDGGLMQAAAGGGGAPNYHSTAAGDVPVQEAIAKSEPAVESKAELQPLGEGAASCALSCRDLKSSVVVMVLVLLMLRIRIRRCPLFLSRAHSSN